MSAPSQAEVRRAAVSVLTAVDLSDKAAFDHVVRGLLSRCESEQGALDVVADLLVLMAAITLDVVMAADDASEGAARARLMEIRLGVSTL